MILENVSLDVDKHPEAGKEYCVLTLNATINGRQMKESISVYSAYIFEEAGDAVEPIFNDIIGKLSSDLLLKYNTHFVSTVDKNIDYESSLSKMREIYEDKS